MRYIPALHLALVSALGLIVPNAVVTEEAFASQAIVHKMVGQVADQTPTASLLVINSEGARLEGGKLMLTGVAKNAIVFADRPIKAAGHLATDELIRQWAEGADNFREDPPNATISVLSGGPEARDAVVTLKSAKLDGTTLIFDVAILEGSLSDAAGPAALFIDHWRGWNHAGWYGLGLATGAAVGAAGLRTPQPAYVAPYYDPYYVPSTCPPGFWLGPWGDCRDTPYHGRLPNGAWQ